MENFSQFIESREVPIQQIVITNKGNRWLASSGITVGIGKTPHEALDNLLSYQDTGEDWERESRLQLHRTQD